MPPKEASKVMKTSLHKVVLSEHTSKPFGSVVTQSALRSLLEAYGELWSIDFAQNGTLCFVTFREKAAVAELVRQGSITVSSCKVQVKNMMYQANEPVRLAASSQRPPASRTLARSNTRVRRAATTPVPRNPLVCSLTWARSQKAKDEEWLAQLFAKPVVKPAGLTITETRQAGQASTALSPSRRATPRRGCCPLLGDRPQHRAALWAHSPRSKRRAAAQPLRHACRAGRAARQRRRVAHRAPEQGDAGSRAPVD